MSFDAIKMCSDTKLSNLLQLVTNYQYCMQTGQISGVICREAILSLARKYLCYMYLIRYICSIKVLFKQRWRLY